MLIILIINNQLLIVNYYIALDYSISNRLCYNILTTLFIT